ncbi:MAG: DUF1800 domain-containing protein [Pseudomonadota bacterium]
MKLSPDMAAAIATNRFGLGARQGEMRIARAAPRRWLIDQLGGPSRLPSAIRSLPPSSKTLVQVTQLQRERRMKREQGKKDEFGPTVRGHYADAVLARTRQAVTTRQSFYERLVQFWSNHFTVSAEQAVLPALAGAIENEVVRPNIDKSFVDMLIAAEQHPSMLIYLDNAQSTGPQSQLGRRMAKRRPNRQTGLNENLAREIMELHTLGVDGGYSQRDVTAFARAITGWSVARQGASAGGFEFHPNRHEPGAQTIMGTRYAQAGVQQGLAVLRDLASHPATARHIATKLARHFAGDRPPASLIDDLARVFEKRNGDLVDLHRTLVDAGALWLHEPVKYKTPNELVLSTMRALGHKAEDPKAVMNHYRLLGQMPFRPGSPAGWPDTADDWRGGNALQQRIEWINAVARRTRSAVDVSELATEALGGALGDNTALALRRAESQTQALTLLLASPNFQRR